MLTILERKIIRKIYSSRKNRRQTPKADELQNKRNIKWKTHGEDSKGAKDMFV